LHDLLKKVGEKMSVKIIIKRHVPKGKEAELAPLLIDLRSKAMAQPGYISGETLRNADDPEEYLVVGTWQSIDAWQDWQSSSERAAIQGKIDSLLGEKTDYSVYYYG
jgi:heme-degrading monooxygenase HmoA